MKQTKQHKIDTTKFLYAPMSSITGNIYQRNIADGLWTILSRASLFARKNKNQFVEEGYNLTLDIKGRPRGTQPITFVIYHVPFDHGQNKTIGSFDVPKIDHSKINHFKLVRWTIQAIKRTCPDAEVIVCTDEIFGNAIKDMNTTILIPSVQKNRPMYYRAKTYNTIIQNRWLKGTTVFLDSDAIVLKDPRYLPDLLNFKVGVTARFAPNLMPINEGVLLLKAIQKIVLIFLHTIWGHMNGQKTIL